jgi:hypothetical protein
MKIFISWSGQLSNEVAKKLSEWIPTVIQSVEVFYSPDDIEKGENWDSRLSEELSACNYGIVCLTRQNILAPWIHFEAGALKKTVEARLSALMIDVTASDIKGPLSHLQNTKYEKDDFFRLVNSINENIEKPLSDNRLAHSFEKMWGDLERDISAIIEKYATADDKKDKNPKDEALDEILRIVRQLDQKIPRPNPLTLVQHTSTPVPNTPQYLPHRPMSFDDFVAGANVLGKGSLMPRSINDLGAHHKKTPPIDKNAEQGEQ